MSIKSIVKKVTYVVVFLVAYSFSSAVVDRLFPYSEVAWSEYSKGCSSSDSDCHSAPTVNLYLPFFSALAILALVSGEVKIVTKS